MIITDPLLPAAAHLTGPGAIDLLRTAVRAGGGTLESARPCHVQYRPGSDLVVRYSARLAWNGRETVSETLLAGATVDGPPPGTLPLVADTVAGDMHVGVWRWPFDPVLAGLGHIVTADTAAELLGDHVGGGPVRLEVVAYRPTERAVVKATSHDGRVYYLKAVPPTLTSALVERHGALRAAGVPVPEVVAVDAGLGVFAMDELPGDTLRVRLKEGLRPWPAADEFNELATRFAGATIPGAARVASRADHAIGHAAMLASVLPDQRPRLDRISDTIAAVAERSRQRTPVTIHGDLHEAQLVLDDDRICGVLDIDDAGPGDPLGDRATLLAHLRYRAATEHSHGAAIGAYADRLRRDFANGSGGDVDPAELDRMTAAVVVGLATGPFRIQQRGWRHAARRQLAITERLLAGADERSLSDAS